MTSARAGWVDDQMPQRVQAVEQKVRIDLRAQRPEAARRARRRPARAAARRARRRGVHREVDREPAREGHREAGGDAERARRGHHWLAGEHEPEHDGGGQPDGEARRRRATSRGSRRRFDSWCQPCTYIQRRSPWVAAGQTTPLKNTMLTMSAALSDGRSAGTRRARTRGTRPSRQPGKSSTDGRGRVVSLLEASRADDERPGWLRNGSSSAKNHCGSSNMMKCRAVSVMREV